MVYCFAPTCNQSLEGQTCKFFAFPSAEKQKDEYRWWMRLLRLEIIFTIAFSIRISWCKMRWFFEAGIYDSIRAKKGRQLAAARTIMFKLLVFFFLSFLWLLRLYTLFVSESLSLYSVLYSIFLIYFLSDRRQDREPSKHSRVCSCYFRDGKKVNGLEIYARNQDK